MESYNDFEGAEHEIVSGILNMLGGSVLFAAGFLFISLFFTGFTGVTSLFAFLVAVYLDLNGLALFVYGFFHVVRPVVL